MSRHEYLDYLEWQMELCLIRYMHRPSVIELEMLELLQKEFDKFNY